MYGLTNIVNIYKYIKKVQTSQHKAPPCHPSVFGCTLQREHNCLYTLYYFRKLWSSDFSFLFSPSGHVFKAEELLSRWSALIPWDKKLLLALVQWSHPFPVIATSMHQNGDSMWKGNSRYSHAELRKGTGAVGFDEWWIALKSAHFHLRQLSDGEKMFQPWEITGKNFSADWGGC